MFTQVSGSLSQKFSGFFSKLTRQFSTRFTTTKTLYRHSSHSSQTVTSACGKIKREPDGSILGGGSSSAMSHNIQLPSGLPLALRKSKLSSSTSAHRLPYTAATRGYGTSLSSKSPLSDLQSTAVVSTIQTRGYAAQKIEHYKCKRGSNIILMGAPGAGKTVVARELGALLKMKVIDVDDHVLEPSWGMSVAEKLAHVGGKEMLDLEAQTFMKFKAERSIISLSGSQPMNDDSMDYARKLGTIVYLDVEKQDILDRLNVMKVNRIVGQEKGIGMDTILSYRQQFYERHYDIRVICPRNESVEATAKRITKLLKRWGPKKGFRSTRSNSKFDTFLDVTVQGLAPDRGLYVSSTEIPHMSIGQWERLVDKPYTDCALKILEQWIPPSEVNHKELRTLINLAYTHENFSHKDIAPIVPLENNQYLLELFHGPTASFKDIPMQLTARLFDYAVKRMKTGVRSLILVATSGDTGGAVMNAFSRHTDNSDVVVLFPEDGVSSIQKAQLTSFDGPRAISIGVKGDFDYCQTAIKDIFMDHKYEEKMRIGLGYGISAANSINFARLLPQVVYHAWSYLVMVRDGHIKLGDKIDICVPTGNFGNILGAYYAKQMGIPIRNMTIASNSNNVLSEFFKTGEYDIGYRTLMTTLSPAIDILRSSNLERYLYTASGNDYSLMAHLFKTLEETGKFAIKKDSELFRKMQRDFSADWCTDEESKDTIKEVFKRTGYLIDPHTAVAKTVADRHSLGADVPLVISATAHYSKFADGILKSLGLQSETYTNDPVELMNKALKLTENPSKHKNLLKDVSNVRPHKVIQNPNQETIRDHIETFINDYYDERRATKKP